MFSLSYLIALIIIAAVYVFISMYMFCPTRYWWSKTFHLYRWSDNFDDIDNVDLVEIEMLLHFLILHRCSDENGTIQEIRNGFILTYYPEGANRNKRAWPYDYVEIYDNNIDVLLRIGFDGDIPTYQLEYRQADETIDRMFFRSKQGNMNDFSKVAYDKQTRREIVERYKTWVMKNVL